MKIDDLFATTHALDCEIVNFSFSGCPIEDSHAS